MNILDEAHKNLRAQTCGALRIYSRVELDPEQIGELSLLLKVPAEAPTQRLGGRAGVSNAIVAGLGDLVVKHYFRGGAMRFMVQSMHVNFRACLPWRHRAWLASRPYHEFALLDLVRSLRVAAPAPVAFAIQGGVFYRGWLFTENIGEHKSLAQLALEDDSALPKFVSELARQMQTLIENNIFHVDLHPGNVVVNSAGEVYILDFDRAEICWAGQKPLRDQYLRRWRRAAIKHELPETLSEMFCLEMRKLSLA